MARALLISEQVREQIAEAIAEAAKNPLDVRQLQQFAHDKAHLSLADRRPGPKRPQSPFVLIPIGYRASISFEMQPAGLCKHLSVSVDRAGALPHPAAVAAIASEFGIDAPSPTVQAAWTEEFEPGSYAVNLVALVTAPAGNA